VSEQRQAKRRKLWAKLWVHTKAKATLRTLHCYKSRAATNPKNIVEPESAGERTSIVSHAYHFRVNPEGLVETTQIIIPRSYQNDFAIRNTTDTTGGNPIAWRSQCISCVSAVNPLVAFYVIHGRKGALRLFCFVPYSTRDHTSVHNLIHTANYRANEVYE
jgi:hypothetical protein